MFDSQFTRVVYVTKILESLAFRSIKLERRLLATTIFMLAQPKNVSKYFVADIKYHVVDTFLGKDLKIESEGPSIFLCFATLSLWLLFTIYRSHHMLYRN
jgi:hypothetical protein